MHRHAACHPARGEGKWQIGAEAVAKPFRYTRSAPGLKERLCSTSGSYARGASASAGSKAGCTYSRGKPTTPISIHGARDHGR